VNEESLNRTVRQFLKVLGVNSQREIEGAIRRAVQEGRLKGTESLTAKAVVTLPAIDVRFEIEGEIELE
jgi:hypothetical protein